MNLLTSFMLATLAAGLQATDSLTVQLVGNAGVSVSDGATTLLVDLPYESGAFGYMTYDADALNPDGAAVAVITHHHRDHFAAELFGARASWRVIGPPSVVDGLPLDRVLADQRVEVGEFVVTAIATPHTPDHRSYQVQWRDLTLYFVGDTEDPTRLRGEPDIDLLFVTPWLSCAATQAGGLPNTGRTIAYHLQPDGSDRVCGDVEVLEQGTQWRLER